MSKELIERLREGVADTGILIKSAANVNATMNEAADLIEQLQRELLTVHCEAEELSGQLTAANKLIEKLREGLRKAAYMVRENTITPGGNPFALQEIEALAAAKQWKEGV